jgi:DNA-binding MarR family transcriptional regulator
MEAALRPYDLGATQWYVLHQLSQHGTIMQRDLLRMLEVERATLSTIVTTMVRKGLIKQVPDRADRRQKLLRITAAGRALWDKLPDLALIHQTAFSGLHAADVAATIRVLRLAVERLERLSKKGTDEWQSSSPE